MNTFDYESAWLEVAAPAYKALPDSIHRLVDLVAVRCADLHQLSDCSMPWPDDDNAGADSLQRAFEDVSADVLAYAAQVVHNFGHWWPRSIAGDYSLPGREQGSHWKFAHYADQTLRAKLGLPARGSNGHERGYGYAVHEGVIRLTYADSHSWNWIEIAPATPEGYEKAREVAGRFTTKDDSARWQAFEEYKTVQEWPTPEWAAIADLTPYMVDDGVMKQRHAARMPAEDRAKLRTRMVADVDHKIEKLKTKLAGFLWVLDAGLPTDNLIYYDHTGVFCFGWREPIGPEFEARILDVISEFPYPYEIRCAGGRKLEAA